MDPQRIVNPSAMTAAGAQYAQEASRGTIIALVGELGTGKTCFSTGFIKALQPNASPSSPTYSIVNEFRKGEIPIFHFDLYRLKSQQEVIALGWDDYIDQNGIILCEWANLYPTLFPNYTTWITLEYHPTHPEERLLTS